MAQPPYKACTQCGTSIPVSQRFCSNCGSDQGANATPHIDSTMPASGNFTPPPPPPPQNISGAGQYSNPPYQQGGQGPYQQGGQGPYQQGGQGPYQQGYQQPPAYAQAPQNSGGNGVGVMGAILGFLLLRRAERRAGSWIAGCFVWIIIIVAIIICVVVSRLATSHQISSSINDITKQSTPVSNIKKSTVPINSTTVYSGITITIVDAQQAPSFTDDSESSSQGILRLDMKEQAGAINGVGFDYTTIVQLVAPDGTTINADSALHSENPDASTSRTNWIDFPITKNIQVSQYTARIGSPTEAQISIPLTGKADLSQYAPKKSTPNKKFTYGGLDFTINTATTGLSDNGPQANKGMMYVIVDVTGNNNSSHQFYGDLTNVRLKSGATASPPADFLPNLAPGQTNVPISLVFIMPQGSTNFSLVFLASSDNQATKQASTDFQIP
jgi:Domain of unknown function (DUF4352)